MIRNLKTLLKKIAPLVSAIIAPVLIGLCRNAPNTKLKIKCAKAVRLLKCDYTTKTKNGVSMSGNSADFVQLLIYCFGIWEPNLTTFIRQRIKSSSDRVFIDVGANVGYFSLLVGNTAPNWEIVAIEPVPVICNRLSKNIELNKLSNISVLNCAATAEHQRLNIYYGGLDNEGRSSISMANGNQTFEIEGYPLSDLIKEAQMQRIRLIKIDTEGHEHAVLEGLSPVLSRLPNDAEVIIEVSPDESGSANTILKIFDEHGFYPYEISNIHKIRAYADTPPYQAPRRLSHIPQSQTDVIFSRIDADTLD